MKVNIAGVPIHVVSDEECEKADYVVCADAGLPTPWADNVIAACSDCGGRIIHRPHVPQRPPKICVECAMLRAEAGHGPH